MPCTIVAFRMRFFFFRHGCKVDTIQLKVPDSTHSREGMHSIGLESTPWENKVHSNGSIQHGQFKLSLAQMLTETKKLTSSKNYFTCGQCLCQILGILCISQFGLFNAKTGSHRGKGEHHDWQCHDGHFKASPLPTQFLGDSCCKVLLHTDVAVLAVNCWYTRDFFSNTMF